MTNALKEAIAEVASLPKAAQDKIGEELLLHVEKIRELRGKLDTGIRSLDRGDSRELDIEDILERARAPYGEA